jgi:DNA invertase Pin-like site-specific DNA recombinase
MSTPKMDHCVIPAAQYLRMSREHQRYSIRNQARAIASFATEHGYQVVRTYTDPGRSGLTLRERPGLRSLLAEAMSPHRSFKAVLVLDVSRWGRFQDLDQSAHYEFLCREAGVSIVYCAEPFENDGSPAMALMKQIKRLMAAEYSRELSGKVLRAQMLQAKLGHKQGGERRYGFRRVVIDHAGREVMTLERGQSKVLSDHRVIYAHGPEHELQVIRDIFRMYNRDRLSFRGVARRLNEAGAPSKDGRRWTEARVRGVLKNELVVGFYVFNRTSRPLKGALRRNPQDAWVSARVLEPIVSRTSFDLAAKRMAIRRHGVSAEDALRAIERLYRAKGFLSHKLIDECPYTPSTSLLRDRFGDVRRVYELVGYNPPGRWHPSDQAAPASDHQLLDLLRKLYEREGYVSEMLITCDRSLPVASIYQRRFGSLTRAYELAGLPHSLTELQRLGRERRLARGRNEAPQRSKGPRWPALPTKFSDDELIECLRRIHAAFGYVSADLIRLDEASPTPMLFVRRFGSLLLAYERAGLPCTRREIWGRASRVRWQARPVDDATSI